MESREFTLVANEVGNVLNTGIRALSILAKGGPVRPL
jgi:hypothetical protein